VRNAEEWNFTSTDAPPVLMPLQSCPPTGPGAVAEESGAPPAGGPLPLPGLGQRRTDDSSHSGDSHASSDSSHASSDSHTGDSRARIDTPGHSTAAQAPAAPAPDAYEPPHATTDDALAPAAGPSAAVEGAPAPDSDSSVLRRPGAEAASAAAAAAAGAGAMAAGAGRFASAPEGAPFASAATAASADPGGHGQPAWHWVLLALGLAAFVALCAFAVLTIRRRRALASATTTTYDNQAFVGPNKAPAAAAAPRAAETV